MQRMGNFCLSFPHGLAERDVREKVIYLKKKNFYVFCNARLRLPVRGYESRILPDCAYKNGTHVSGFLTLEICIYFRLDFRKKKKQQQQSLSW